MSGGWKDYFIPGTTVLKNLFGAPVFALFFGLGLFAIVILGAELATGSMMYVVFGPNQPAC